MTVTAAEVEPVGRHDAPEAVDVVLVSGQRLLTRGIELMLENSSGGHVRVVASTGKPRQALDLVRWHRPQVAVVDLTLPSPGAPALIGQLKRQRPQMGVLALSEASDSRALVLALRAGAEGLLPKVAGPGVLAAGLQSIAGGLCVLPPAVLAPLLGAVRNRLLVDDLGSEDQQLWRLVAEGADSCDIARSLFISERTAKRRVQALLRRLHVANRAQAAALAGRCGLLDGFAQIGP